jgi:hypothetical protein
MRAARIHVTPPRARLQWAADWPRALVLALLCVLYLVNLTGGWIEIPDCLPIVGNRDVVAVTVALVRCLGRMGFEVVPG